MANVAMVYCDGTGAVLGYVPDFAVAPFVVDYRGGAITPYYKPLIGIELLDGAADYGSIPAAAGDSSLTAAQRLAAYNASPGGGTAALTIADIYSPVSDPANPIQES